MAVNLDNLKIDQEVVLNQDFKSFTKGLVMLVKKWMPVGPNQIVMCAIPGSDARPQGFQHHMLDLVGGAAPAAEQTQDEDDLSGPVADYFGTYANLDETVAANFAGAYISNMGTADLSILESVMEQEGVAPDTAWTLGQTANMYRAFSEMFGLEEDAEIDGALEVAAAQDKAAAAAKAAEAKRGPGRPPKDTPAPAAAVTKPAAAVAAAATKPAEKSAVIDKDRWDAIHMISMDVAGMLMSTFAQNPDNFDRILEKANAMCRAAGRSTK